MTEFEKGRALGLVEAAKWVDDSGWLDEDDMPAGHSLLRALSILPPTLAIVPRETLAIMEVSTKFLASKNKLIEELEAQLETARALVQALAAKEANK